MRSAEHQVQSGTATSGSCFHRRCKPAFGDARDDRASAQLRRRAVSEHVHDRGRHPIDPPLVTQVRNPERNCRSRARPHGKLVRFTRVLMMQQFQSPRGPCGAFGCRSGCTRTVEEQNRAVVRGKQLKGRSVRCVVQGSTAATCPVPMSMVGWQRQHNIGVMLPWL